MYHNSRKKYIIFDLDDTLINTTSVYYGVIDQFVQILKERYNFREDTVRMIFERIDRKNVKRMGVSKERFAISLKETYIELCNVHNLSACDAKYYYSLGTSVYDADYSFVEGAKQTLEKLKKSNTFLILYTQGDYGLQRKEITKLELNSYFDNIYIFKKKTAKTLASIIQYHNIPKENTFVVGDGFKSEINPALHLGLTAILIDVNTWHYENQKPIGTKYVVVKDLTSILEICLH